MAPMGGFGADAEGMEVANMLAEQGKKVSLVTKNALGENGRPIDGDLYRTLRNKLINHGVAIFPHSPVFEIRENGVYVADNRELLFLPADTVVLAVGKSAQTQLAEELKGAAPEIHAIGDCVEPRDALHAIREGTEVGRVI